MRALVTRAGTPVLVEVSRVGGISSGLVRAGPVDIEVLRIGRQPPRRPQGYGLGFVADTSLEEAAAILRSRGFATSAPVRGVAGRGKDKRTWRVVQVEGLLHDPFPAGAGTGPPSVRDRVIGVAASAVNRVPPLARAATSKAGSSMVVVTEYGFDVERWRAAAGRGPELVGVHVGTTGHGARWADFPLSGDVPLHLHDEGPAGITRLVLARGADDDHRHFSIGDIAVEFV